MSSAKMTLGCCPKRSCKQILKCLNGCVLKIPAWCWFTIVKNFTVSFHSYSLQLYFIPFVNMHHLRMFYEGKHPLLGISLNIYQEHGQAQLNLAFGMKGIYLASLKAHSYTKIFQNLSHRHKKISDLFFLSLK